jgi:hypothetical protein
MGVKLGLTLKEEQSWIVLQNYGEYMDIGEYSGHKITPNLGYVAVRGEGKMETARGSKMAKSLSEYV